ncbi:MAG: hypothetical protein Q8K26_03965 [Candidatus Gracilibacteria bacterium]|nr:hypothetical protein [Candidatus Gracilibacteria bacterium]
MEIISGKQKMEITKAICFMGLATAEESLRLAGLNRESVFEILGIGEDFNGKTIDELMEIYADREDFDSIDPTEIVILIVRHPEIRIEILRKLYTITPNGSEDEKIVIKAINEKIEKLLSAGVEDFHILYELYNIVPSGSLAEEMIAKTMIKHPEANLNILPEDIKRKYMAQVIAEKIRRIL